MTTVTQFIKENLKAHIQSEPPLPYKLTLADISKYYGVSLMPVRAAVNDLINEALLIRNDNGRLSINANIVPSMSTPEMLNFAPPQIKNRHTEAIAHEVIVRGLKQDNGYLREEATAAKYGIGRTMVRQIFTRLSGEGLMEHVPRCGWRIRPYRETDMQAYLAVRELLEVEALCLARARLCKEDLQAMLQANHSGESGGEPRLDNQLHLYWIERCDNRYIQEFFSRYGAYYSELFNYAALEVPVKRAMAIEHRRILECLIADDYDGASTLLIQHIRDQRDNLARMIAYLKNR